MTFNIGNQSGGVINNVAGDQHITGGQHGTLVSTEDARRAVGELRRAVTAAGLGEATAAARPAARPGRLAGRSWRAHPRPAARAALTR